MSGIDVTWRVDGDPLSMRVEGELLAGGDACLLDADDDLTAATAWADAGYTVAPFLAPQPLHALRDGLFRLLRKALGEAGASVPADFDPVRYHHYCMGNDDTHLAVVRWMQAASPIDNFPIGHALVDQCISALVGTRVSCIVPGREAAGRFFLRIVRPGCRLDHNPPHRDAWLDRLRDGINVYVPLAGSTARSSLPLLPGSHRWPESDVLRTRAGACINRVHYTVPAAVACRQGMVMTRPVVSEGEVMVFSPYLIHGGAANLNADITRISLEMRFWRVD